jgi:hypothetical protein
MLTAAVESEQIQNDFHSVSCCDKEVSSNLKNIYTFKIFYEELSI